MSPQEHLEAEARLHFFADTIGKEPPVHLMDPADPETFAPEFLTWCWENGASLDWICLGDLRGMVLASHRDRRRELNNA